MRALAALPPRRQGRSVSAADAACPPMNKNQGGEGSSMYLLAKRPLIAPDERGLTPGVSLWRGARLGEGPGGCEEYPLREAVGGARSV